MTHPRPGLRVGVVGAGRVGAVLAHALRMAAGPDGHGYTVTAAAGESDASRERIAALLPGVPVRKPSDVARACDLLLLTVPDDMLANVVGVLARSGAITPGQVVVHTSGRHGLAVLGPARQAGARTIALHPAMTFTGTALDVERLAGCVFGVTVDVEPTDDQPDTHPDAQPDTHPDAHLARTLVADLGGRYLTVAEERRTLYHAGLAHGANHLVTLVSEAMEVLAAAGSDDPAATLRPLLEAALANALDQGDAALTGPIVRGDVGTVRAHLTDLAARSPQALPSYLTLARATVARATTDGRLLPIRAAAILAALDDAAAARPAGIGAAS